MYFKIIYSLFNLLKEYYDFGSFIFCNVVVRCRLEVDSFKKFELFVLYFIVSSL